MKKSFFVLSLAFLPLFSANAQMESIELGKGIRVTCTLKEDQSWSVNPFSDWETIQTLKVFSISSQTKDLKKLFPAEASANEIKFGKRSATLKIVTDGITDEDRENPVKVNISISGVDTSNHRSDFSFEW